MAKKVYEYGDYLPDGTIHLGKDPITINEEDDIGVAPKEVVKEHEKSEPPDLITHPFFNTLLDNKIGRALLFVIFFLLAALITGLINRYDILHDYGEIFYFPAGVCISSVDAWNTWPICFGWAIYIGLAFFGIRSPNQRTFIRIFMVFCLVLIFNLGGCVFGDY